ncbi:MAG TPA: 2-succinylbenzoate--CoA ligase [Deltaproteobacteria bacterium]|nr:2-succinylbenzoate--CoA ligase [Deltaproteobacteria bacterium]
MVELNPNLLNQLKASFAKQQFLISESRSWTFADFLEESFTLSNSLYISAQKRVALCTENPEFLLKAMLALWIRGAVAVPLNPKFPPKQKNELIHKIGGLKHVHLAEDFHGLLQNNTINPDLKKSASRPQIEHSINPDAWATIIFTSGSSGSPKAVVHSLANHYYSALGANQIMPLNPGDRWLLSLPLYHVSGLAIFFRTLISGATMVMPPDNEALAESILKYKITHISLVPTQLHRLLKTIAGKESLLKLKLILLGGSAIPENLLEQAEHIGLNIKTTYGSTEMASQVATGKKGNCRVLPFREIRISTASETYNEIEVRGKTRFLGYLEKSGLSQPFDENGWFKTGDLGAWETGFPERDKNDSSARKKLAAEKNDSLTVMGRKDNMFISGGENIHPEEIERVLFQSGKIEQAVVVPVKDSKFGERPVAFLKYSESASVEELRKLLGKRLLRFKIPDLFLAWPEEVGNGMKPNRKELSRIAQPQFKLKQKQNTADRKAGTAVFNQWLAQFPLGWMRIAMSEERQVFLLLDLRKGFRKRGLYVRANSRKEVMAWILAQENSSLFKMQNGKKENNNWFSITENKRGMQRESFEIIRILADELPEKQIFIYDAQDRKTFKTIVLSPKTAIATPAKNRKFHSTDTQYFADMESEFNKGWDWDFPEAVFQSGMLLPEFKRMYLVRCLYKRTDSANKFLGWKVQLLSDLSSSEYLEHPFWELSQEEEQALANELRESGMFTEIDFQQANTPQMERKRRTVFQNEVDNMFYKQPLIFSGFKK